MGIWVISRFISSWTGQGIQNSKKKQVVIGRFEIKLILFYFFYFVKVKLNVFSFFFFIQRRRTDLPTEKAILPPENVETPEIDGRDDVGEKEASFERERKMLVFTVLLNSLGFFSGLICGCIRDGAAISALSKFVIVLRGLTDVGFHILVQGSDLGFCVGEVILGSPVFGLDC